MFAFSWNSSLFSIWSASVFQKWCCQLLKSMRSLMTGESYTAGVYADCQNFSATPAEDLLSTSSIRQALALHVELLMKSCSVRQSWQVQSRFSFVVYSFYLPLWETLWTKNPTSACVSVSVRELLCKTGCLHFFQNFVSSEKTPLLKGEAAVFTAVYWHRVTASL